MITFYSFGDRKYATRKAAIDAMQSFDPIQWSSHFDEDSGEGYYYPQIVKSYAVVEHTITDEFGDQQSDSCVTIVDENDPRLRVRFRQAEERDHPEMTQRRFEKRAEFIADLEATRLYGYSLATYNEAFILNRQFDSEKALLIFESLSNNRIVSEDGRDFITKSAENFIYSCINTGEVDTRFTPDRSIYEVWFMPTDSFSDARSIGRGTDMRCLKIIEDFIMAGGEEEALSRMDHHERIEHDIAKPSRPEESEMYV